MSPDFEAWRDQSTAFDQLAGFLTDTEPIDAGDEVIQARVAAVTEGFWDLTGATFSLGGPPPAGQDGVVLPHTFFERWFRADATIIGRPVMLDGRQSVITGVLPADFRPQLVSPPAFIDAGGGDIDVYRANVIRPSAGPGVQILNVIGRLKPDVSIDRRAKNSKAFANCADRQGTEERDRVSGSSLTSTRSWAPPGNRSSSCRPPSRWSCSSSASTRRISCSYGDGLVNARLRSGRRSVPGGHACCGNFSPRACSSA